MVRVLVNWWAYTWGGLIFGGLIFGGLRYLHLGTHLMKGFPKYRRIRKRTQLPVDPQNCRHYECERAMHACMTQTFIL